jgi:hypothetical protein
MFALNPPVNHAAHEELVTRIQQHLSSRFRGLKVRVKEGGIVLKGRVQTYYAKQLAQHLVMQQTELPILSNDIEVA